MFGSTTEAEGVLYYMWPAVPTDTIAAKHTHTHTNYHTTIDNGDRVSRKQSMRVPAIRKLYCHIKPGSKGHCRVHVCVSLTLLLFMGSG